MLHLIRVCTVCFNIYNHFSVRAQLFKTKLSLVNVSLKFRMLINQIHQYFLLKQYKKVLQKVSLIFSTKNTSVFGYNNYLILNKLVKLICFEQLKIQIF